jgi:hypothetical protein
MAGQGPQPLDQEGASSFVKKFPKDSPKKMAIYIVSALLVVLAGIGTGWLLSGGASGSRLVRSGDEKAAPGARQNGQEAGVEDESTFSDTAEGVLEAGGIDGEGTHHLVREGGESKYVYLTSTVIDLESFVGKNVQVWGETIAAQQAGWLMDVGKIKVQE